MSGKYTMVILSWMRPRNVEQLLTRYVEYPEIDEILVSCGNKDFPINFNHPKRNKVSIINDVELNNSYGLNLRYLNGLAARNESIIYTDDDELVEREVFLKVIAEHEKKPNRIVGIVGRPINGYEDFKNQLGNEIILTKFLITNKEVLRLYFVLFPFFHDIFKKATPFGNGEDILLSLIAREFYKEENIAVGSFSDMEPLNTHGVGCDTWGGHLGYRAELCRYWTENENLLKSIINNYKRGLKRESYSKNKKLNLTIGTGYDEGYSELGDFTKEINRSYAKKFNHQFESYNTKLDDRPPAWHKLLFAEKCLPHCDWFMWIDADACFTPHAGCLKMEDFLDDDYFFICQKGFKNQWTLNSGVFFIKNCPKSFDFLSELYKTSPLEKHLPHYVTNWWEQNAIIHLSGYDFKRQTRDVKTNFSDGVKVLDYNSLWKNINDSKRLPAAIAHCPGPASLAQKRGLLQAEINLQ